MTEGDGAKEKRLMGRHDAVSCRRRPGVTNECPQAPFSEITNNTAFITVKLVVSNRVESNRSVVASVWSSHTQ
jgi:hypothetical protein